MLIYAVLILISSICFFISRDSMFVPASWGQPVFVAFTPSACVVEINCLQFPFPYVFCYHLHPPLLWSANLFSVNKNFSYHDRCFTFSRSFYLPIPPSSLASCNLRNTFNFSYLFPDILIFNQILTRFSTHPSEHFISVASVNILDSHST